MRLEVSAPAPMNLTSPPREFASTHINTHSGYRHASWIQPGHSPAGVVMNMDPVWTQSSWCGSEYGSSLDELQLVWYMDPVWTWSGWCGTWIQSGRSPAGVDPVWTRSGWCCNEYGSSQGMFRLVSHRLSSQCSRRRYAWNAMCLSRLTTTLLYRPAVVIEREISCKLCHGVTNAAEYFDGGNMQEYIGCCRCSRPGTITVVHINMLCATKPGGESQPGRLFGYNACGKWMAAFRETV